MYRHTKTSMTLAVLLLAYSAVASPQNPYGSYSYPQDSDSYPTDAAEASSYAANADWTTYGPSNHPTWSGASPGTWTQGPWDGNGGEGYGPFTPGPWLTGPYTAWWAADTTATSAATASTATDATACPPATWPGWTLGSLASAPWTTWSACEVSSTSTVTVTTTDGVGATITMTSIVYEGLQDAAAVTRSAVGSAVTLGNGVSGKDADLGVMMFVALAFVAGIALLL